MKTILKPIATALFFITAAPASADGDLLPDAGDALQRLLTLIEVIVASLPQYELPEVLENGDIIIRRVQKDPDDVPEDDGKAI